MLIHRLIQALHLQPNDKTIIYNIAMIQQKAAEISFDTKPAKRTLNDLRRAIEQAAHAQKYVLTNAPLSLTEFVFIDYLHH